jgi:hypothetical protein
MHKLLALIFALAIAACGGSTPDPADAADAQDSGGDASDGASQDAEITDAEMDAMDAEQPPPVDASPDAAEEPE